MAGHWSFTLLSNHNLFHIYLRSTPRLTLRMHPPTLREAVLVVLPKPVTDPLLFGSDHPLSFLNSDYKILGKELANRLILLVQYAVHQDQSGFIPRRNMFLNLHQLFMLMDWAHEMGMLPWFASLDIEKAFDTLDWGYLMEVLGRFRMGLNSYMTHPWLM